MTTGVIILGAAGSGAARMRPLNSTTEGTSEASPAGGAFFGAEEEAYTPEGAPRGPKKKKKILPLLQYRAKAPKPRAPRRVPEGAAAGSYGEDTDDDPFAPSAVDPVLIRDRLSPDHLATSWQEMLRGQTLESRQIRQFDAPAKSSSWSATDEEIAIEWRRRASAEAAAAREADAAAVREAAREASSHRRSSSAEFLAEPRSKGRRQYRPVKALSKTVEPLKLRTTAVAYKLATRAVSPVRTSADEFYEASVKRDAAEATLAVERSSSSTQQRKAREVAQRDREARFVAAMTKATAAGTSKRTALDDTHQRLLADHRKLVRRYVASLMPESQAIYLDDQPMGTAEEGESTMHRHHNTSFGAGAKASQPSAAAAAAAGRRRRRGGKKEVIDDNWLSRRFEVLMTGVDASSATQRGDDSEEATLVSSVRHQQSVDDSASMGHLTHHEGSLSDESKVVLLENSTSATELWDDSDARRTVETVVRRRRPEMAVEEEEEEEAAAAAAAEALLLLAPGTRVECRFETERAFYPAAIRARREDGSYDVDYDDGDFESAVVRRRIRLPHQTAQASIAVGDAVCCVHSAGDDRVLPGRVVAVFEGSLCKVVFDDRASGVRLDAPRGDVFGLFVGEAPTRSQALGGSLSLEKSSTRDESSTLDESVNNNNNNNNNNKAPTQKKIRPSATSVASPGNHHHHHDALDAGLLSTMTGGCDDDDDDDYEDDEFSNEEEDDDEETAHDARRPLSRRGSAVQGMAMEQFDAEQDVAFEIERLVREEGIVEQGGRAKREEEDKVLWERRGEDTRAAAEAVDRLEGEKTAVVAQRRLKPNDAAATAEAERAAAAAAAERRSAREVTEAARREAEEAARAREEHQDALDQDQDRRSREAEKRQRAKAAADQETRRQRDLEAVALDKERQDQLEEQRERRRKRDAERFADDLTTKQEIAQAEDRARQMERQATAELEHLAQVDAAMMIQETAARAAAAAAAEEQPVLVESPKRKPKPADAEDDYDFADFEPDDDDFEHVDQPKN